MRILIADEARFGRINRPRPCWAPIGVRPEVASQPIREYIYLYGAVSPKDGTCVYLTRPRSDTACFQAFLNALSRKFARQDILLVLDGAPNHRCSDLALPGNITLLFLLAGKQATVGDGDAVGIARQIGQHGLGAAEGAFAVDHPFDPARRRQIFREGRGPRGLRARQRIAGGRRHGWRQAFRETAGGTAARARAPAGRSPACRRSTSAVQGNAPARNDHVDMRMVGERRSPGVQHGGHADPRAQVFGVGRDRDHRLGGGLE